MPGIWDVMTGISPICYILSASVATGCGATSRTFAGGVYPNTDLLTGNTWNEPGAFCMHSTCSATKLHLLLCTSLHFDYLFTWRDFPYCDHQKEVQVFIQQQLLSCFLPGLVVSKQGLSCLFNLKEQRYNKKNNIINATFVFPKKLRKTF